MTAWLTIRPATAADVPALVTLARTEYAHYVPAVGREPAPMHADYAGLVEAGAVWVAIDGADGADGTDGEEIVGLLVLLPRPDHLLLDNVAVAPGRQRHGIGSALLAHAETQARSLRLPEVRLYTHETMTDNLAWYPRHGYHVTHRAEQDGYRRVHLAKSLPPA